MQQTRTAPPATLDAVLERITYANQETGYTVARVATQTDWQAPLQGRPGRPGRRQAHVPVLGRSGGPVIWIG